MKPLAVDRSARCRIDGLPLMLVTYSGEVLM
jgi:hypothetical protein